MLRGKETYTMCGSEIYLHNWQSQSFCLLYQIEIILLSPLQVLTMSRKKKYLETIKKVTLGQCYHRQNGWVGSSLWKMTFIASVRLEPLRIKWNSVWLSKWNWNHFCPLQVDGDVHGHHAPRGGEARAHLPEEAGNSVHRKRGETHREGGTGTFKYGF